MLDRPIAGQITKPDLDHGGQSAAASPRPPIRADMIWVLDDTAFDEATYLQAYPDVAEAVKLGTLNAAYDHYLAHGQTEGRTFMPDYREIAQRRFFERPTAFDEILAASAPAPLWNIDALMFAPCGALSLAGWANDGADPIKFVILQTQDHALRLDQSAFARWRRRDVETSLTTPIAGHVGWWSLAMLPATLRLRGRCNATIRFESGASSQLEMEVLQVDHQILRDMTMAHFAPLDYLGDQVAESFTALDPFIGDQVTALSRIISDNFIRGAISERFGPQAATYKASIIVCLYERASYFFLQSALFSEAADHGYEFIYISNSPELADELRDMARIGALMHSASVTMVTLPGNAGIGAANNAAAALARSDRLVFINPDVFPYEPGWAARHLALIETLPADQTRLFGVPLVYGDGALMHGGLHFAFDVGTTMGDSYVRRVAALRIEHTGKGAPLWATPYTTARPVPAISGAFMSIDRAWFEQIGGFSQDYLFGHFADADLCLKSGAAGQAVWLHDLKFWHLEGEPPPAKLHHQGGALINRWLFTRRWGALVESHLQTPPAAEPPASSKRQRRASPGQNQSTP